MMIKSISRVSHDEAGILDQYEEAQTLEVDEAPRKEHPPEDLKDTYLWGHHLLGHSTAW